MIRQFQWQIPLTDEERFPSGCKEYIRGKFDRTAEVKAIYVADVRFAIGTVQHGSRRLTEEFQADTMNDESGSTQNGFGWLMTVTTIITTAMIGVSFYLFAPIRAVRM